MGTNDSPRRLQHVGLSARENSAKIEMQFPCLQALFAVETKKFPAGNFWCSQPDVRRLSGVGGPSRSGQPLKVAGCLVFGWSGPKSPALRESKSSQLGTPKQRVRLHKHEASSVEGSVPIADLM